MDARTQLENLVKTLPEFDASFQGNKDKTFKVKICDHDPILLDTAAGFLVSLNLWNPGSPIAPKLKTELKIQGDAGRLTPESQKVQMRLLAKYLFDLARAGVSGFELQEVPWYGNEMYYLLNSEIKRHCDEWNLENKEKINLEFQCWTKTGAHNFGTCCLMNIHKLNATDLGEDMSHPEMKGRYSHHKIRSKNKEFEIYDIHGDGDYSKQPCTADFILYCIDKGAMACGDLNILESSGAAKKLKSRLPDDQHHRTQQGRLNTLDGFYDPYSS